MHPGFIGWWRAQHASGHPSCGAAAFGPSCGPSYGARGSHGEHHGNVHASGFEDAGGLGVRRPLRFLAHKLELRDDQVTKLAAILSALKTERAQAEVDQRRRITALADVFEATAFDEGKVDHAGDEQAKSAEKLRGNVKNALQSIHALLDEEQRKKFAYLLRTGVLTV